MQSSKRSQIINRVSKYNLLIRTLPNISDLAKGNIVKSDLVELEIDDLLGRDKVEPNEVLMKKYKIKSCFSYWSWRIYWE